jgi:hypothetical protein
MNKVNLPKEVAEAIEYYLRTSESKTDALLDIKRDGNGFGKAAIINNYFSDNNDYLMSALVNGYEIEPSPEIKVRTFYEMAKSDANSGDYDRKFTGEAAQEAVEKVLEYLGIEIEGINA